LPCSSMAFKSYRKSIHQTSFTHQKT
jgi:hypothetical protein